MPTLEDFLRRALEWPDPDSDTGWVSLHWRGQNKQGITGSQAFKTPEDILGFIKWSQTRGKGAIADLYYCTSLQEQHGEIKPNGKYAALRSIDNARSSKLLFTDVDKYPTKRDSFAAVADFCEASSSPYPTALMDSGGGCHAYWILPRAFEREEWLALAHKFDGLMNAYGLKHDNISTDMARILRPPETLNYKRVDQGNLPQPVVLKLLNGDVDLGAWKSLHEATPTIPLTRSTKSFSVPLTAILAFPDAMKGKRPDPAFNSIPLEGEISGTVDPTPVLKLCPMFAEALATGGKDIGQPVWHQQALAATFLAGGYELFHDLGRQHSGYSRESTDAMFYRKVHDRVNKGLGYPSCAAFEADGAPQCKVCPWRDKVQSPLNLPVKEEAPVEAAPEQPADQPIQPSNDTTLPPSNATEMPAPSGLKLPEGLGFDHDSKGFIVKKAKKAKDNERLFESPIVKVEPYTEAVGDAVGLRVTVLKSARDTIYKDIDIPAKAFGEPAGAGVLAALNEGGCAIVGGHSADILKLMSTMKGRMTYESGAARAVTYGWEYKERREGEVDQDEPIGFAYDDRVYSVGGKVRQTFGGDSKLREVYRVTGKPEPWMAALRVVQRMQSPGLQAVVLSAFAAPLMIFTGQPSTVVMVRGQSGGSKSTASAVATAVWAQPRKAMMKPSSSRLGVMKRMGRIRHLPTVWDDIRNEQFETVKDTLMEITQGGEGLKLDANRDEREQGTWDNMLLTSSNNSLVEYLEEISKNDGASLVRCFEFEVPKVVAGEQSYQDPSLVASLISSLDFNHGHAGREYATVLGFAPVGAKEAYKNTEARLIKRVEPYQPHERFWMAAMASIITAGQIANALPIIKRDAAFFNLDEVEDFLIKTYLELRVRHSNANIHADTSTFVKFWLGNFINDYAAKNNEMVWTIDGPTVRGRPQSHPPLWPIGDDGRRMKKVSIRWQRDDRLVKISKGSLDKYLRQEKTSTDRIRQGLVKFYGARVIPRASIAAGLAHIDAQAPETLYEIEINPGTWLDKHLQQHASSGGHQNNDPPQNERTRHQQATHPQPEPKDPEGEKAAS